VSSRACAALIVLGIVLRVGLAAFVPVGVAVGPLRLAGLNDEPSPINYVSYLADSVRFPVQTHAVDDPGAFERNDYEYYQPPAYYALCAASVRLTGADPLVVGRVVSLLCGLATLWVLWHICAAADASPEVRRLAVVCGALFAVHAYFCAVVSNDAMSWLAASAVVLQLLRMVREDGDRQPLWRQPVTLRVLLGAGMRVKSSMLVLSPPAVTACAVRWRRRRDWRAPVWCLALLLSAAIAAPWYARNLRVYGSLLAFNVACGAARAPLDSAGAAIAFVKYSAHTFWFPMQHVPGSPLAGFLGWVGALCAVVCAAAALLELRRGSLSDGARWVLGVLLCSAAVAYVRFNLVWPHAEGRFLLPAFSALMIVLALAARWTARLTPWRQASLALSLALCLWPWLYLLIASPVPLPY